MQKQKLRIVWGLAVIVQCSPLMAELHVSEVERQWQHDSGVRSVAFSADSRLLASAGGWDSTIKVWDVVSGQLQYTLKHQGVIRSVTFSSNGQWLASGSSDKTVKVWNVTSKQLRYTLKHENKIASVAFSPDNKWLASAGADIKLWNMVSGQLLHTFKPERSGGIISIAFSPDGKWLASAAWSILTVWNMASKQLQHTLAKFDPNPPLTAMSTAYPIRICSVTFSPNGAWLLASYFSRIQMWDVTSWQPSSYHGMVPFNDRIHSLAFSPDNAWIATANSGYAGFIMLWNIEMPSLNYNLEEHKGLVLSVAFSPNGKWLASGSQDKSVKLWTLEPPVFSAINPQNSKSQPQPKN
jgi:WD40 repeat protein